MKTEKYLKLLSATALGDRAAFEKLYQLTSGQLYAVGLQILKDKSMADDALQDAFISIWHNASEYTSKRGTVITWMISIMRYRALDLIRSKNIRKNNDLSQQCESTFNSEDSPARLFSERKQRIKLDDCLDELEKPQADAISLAYFRGYTHREIGLHMVSPLGSVKSWIRRGLMRLKRCLDL